MRKSINGNHVDRKREMCKLRRMAINGRDSNYHSFVHSIGFTYHFSHIHLITILFIPYFSYYKYASLIKANTSLDVI